MSMRIVSYIKNRLFLAYSTLLYDKSETFAMYVFSCEIRRIYFYRE